MKSKPTARRVREKKKTKMPPNHYEKRRRAGHIFIAVRSDGTIFGYVENSFSMGFHEQYVRFFPNEAWSKNKGAQKRLYELKKRNQDCEVFMFRAGTARCPLRLNWSELYAKQKNGTLDKFGSRNLRFSVDCDRLESLLAHCFAAK